MFLEILFAFALASSIEAPFARQTPILLSPFTSGLPNNLNWVSSSASAFSKPENFLKVACNVHPWMFAWITVVDHPYFAVSGKDGAFTIANVPPGKYKIQAVHRKAGTATQEIEVKEGAPAKADFTLEVR